MSVPGSKSLPPAIVVGIDSPIGLTVIRELGMHGVSVHGVGRSDSAIGAASRYCASASVRPKDVPLAEWLPDLIAQVSAKALFAVGEQDLISLAALRPVINGCQILTPRAEPLRIVLEKPETLAHAKAVGINVPISWLPAADDDFDARARNLEYPVVVKWPNPTLIADKLARQGFPVVKSEIVRTSQALTLLLRRYAPLGRWPLVQTYCPGGGVGHMIHMHDGSATLRFQHRRLHEWPPEGGVSTLCRAEPLRTDVSQMNLSEILLKRIGWQGPAMVEYRHDSESNRYLLMEINGRFWGSLPLAWHCGAFFAWESYRRSVLGQVSPAAPPRDDLRARYMIPETRRLLRVLFSRRSITDPIFKPRPLRDLMAYVFGFIDPRMRYFVFSLRDPWPFFSDIGSIVRTLLRRGTP